LVENETEKMLKCLRSENGGAYCKKEFNDYHSYHGIRREKIVPGTPQENGVSKRMNGTITKHERSMRLHAGFPLHFLEDDVDTDVYLINRGPSSSLDGGVPKDAWIGKKVNYSFHKTFGCETFVHIHKKKKIEQRLKQNPRSVPLLDMVLMILVIAYGIMKITKSLEVYISYSMTRSWIKISCREGNRKKKNQNT
jgi:hypothetical protein